MFFVSPSDQREKSVIKATMKMGEREKSAKWQQICEQADT